MSVKAVRNVYNQIKAQYFEMIRDIKDFEKECAEGLVEPERVERLKDQVAPIKQNYERWSYIIYLLNQPERKEKQPRYNKANKKFLEELAKENSIEATMEENEEALKHIGE